MNSSYDVESKPEISLGEADSYAILTLDSCSWLFVPYAQLYLLFGGELRYPYFQYQHGFRHVCVYEFPGILEGRGLSPNRGFQIAVIYCE